MDVTRISNQPPMALLDAAPSTGGNGIALRPVSGGDGSADPELSALPTVKLEGLRGTSQAFDVAASPVDSSANGATLDDTKRRFAVPSSNRLADAHAAAPAARKRRLARDTSPAGCHATSRRRKNNFHSGAYSCGRSSWLICRGRRCPAKGRRASVDPRRRERRQRQQSTPKSTQPSLRASGRYRS